jgi:hypothetical protein
VNQRRRFFQELGTRPRVEVTNEATFAAARRHFSDRRVTGLVLRCGYFVALGFSANALQVDLKSDRVPLMGAAGKS